MKPKYRIVKHHTGKESPYFTVQKRILWWWFTYKVWVNPFSWDDPSEVDTAAKLADLKGSTLYSNKNYYPIHFSAYFLAENFINILTTPKPPKNIPVATFKPYTEVVAQYTENGSEI